MEVLYLGIGVFLTYIGCVLFFNIGRGLKNEEIANKKYEQFSQQYPMISKEEFFKISRAIQWIAPLAILGGIALASLGMSIMVG